MLLIVVVLAVFLADTYAQDTIPQIGTNTTEELMPKLNSTFVKLNKNWSFKLIWDENIAREALQEAIQEDSMEADFVIYRKKMFSKSLRNVTTMEEKVERALREPLKRAQRYSCILFWSRYYYGCNGVFYEKDGRDVLSVACLYRKKLNIGKESPKLAE
ncbi:hypothetical protein GCK32_003738 [Trichostrongylus colubriformis]|uniref:Uncharacterized protein n=1 Tax=Trichostrongylus colubriformis TaxID=6319 RepID=A0AAN8IQI0_TRICO